MKSRIFVYDRTNIEEVQEEMDKFLSGDIQVKFMKQSSATAQVWISEGDIGRSDTIETSVTETHVTILYD